MDKVTQATSANAEESAAASEELNAQAEQMKGYVHTLVAVVNGSASRNGGSPHSQAPAHSQRALPATKSGRDTASGGVSKKVTPPEQMIPMKDGEFNDF